MATIKDYQGNSYDTSTLLPLEQQIAQRLDPKSQGGGAWATSGQNIGFDYNLANSIFQATYGRPMNTQDQVALDMARSLNNRGINSLDQLKYKPMDGSGGTQNIISQNAGSWDGDSFRPDPNAAFFAGNHQLTPDEVRKYVQYPVSRDGDGNFGSMDVQSQNALYGPDGKLFVGSGDGSLPYTTPDGLGQYFGGTATGKGATQYSLTPDANGNLSFGTTGTSTSDFTKDDALGLLTVAGVLGGAAFLGGGSAGGAASSSGMDSALGNMPAWATTGVDGSSLFPNVAAAGSAGASDAAGATASQAAGETAPAAAAPGASDGSLADYLMGNGPNPLTSTPEANPAFAPSGFGNYLPPGMTSAGAALAAGAGLSSMSGYGSSVDTSALDGGPMNVNYGGSPVTQFPGTIPNIPSQGTGLPNGTSNLPTLPGTGSGSGLGSLGSVLPLGAGLFADIQQQRAASTMINWLQSQQSKMDGLYGVDSPMAKYMWNQMSAKDAAAGRNSQYGPRTVDFLGKYANDYAGNINTFTQGTSRALANALTQRASVGSGTTAALGNMNTNGSLESLINSLTNSGSNAFTNLPSYGASVTDSGSALNSAQYQPSATGNVFDITGLGNSAASGAGSAANWGVDMSKLFQ